MLASSGRAGAFRAHALGPSCCDGVRDDAYLQHPKREVVGWQRHIQAHAPHAHGATGCIEVPSSDPELPKRARKRPVWPAVGWLEPASVIVSRGNGRYDVMS